jgi:large subunit ribosomal protein L25
MFELKTKIREEKVNNNELRNKGYVPAVLYGPKIKNANIMVSKKDLAQAYESAGESTLLKLVIAGEKNKEYMVLIHQTAFDPVSDELIHVDFYQPRLDEEIEADVSLEFVGQSTAVNTLGGVLIKNMHEITVRALPQNLPREIEVDISTLKTFDDIIHIKDLKLTEGVTVSAELEDVVALVEPPRTEEQLKELEEKPETEATEAEVISKEKKEEAEEPAAAESKEPSQE